MITLRNIFSRKQKAVRLPAVAENARGVVVLSYLREPFLDATSGPPRGHTNWQECRSMAVAWRQAGFSVEVVDRRDRDYIPPRHAFAVVDLGVNLGRWAETIPSSCRKILHATGAHWRVQNAAEQRRLSNLVQRRGLVLKPRRQNIENRGAEAADDIVVLGNDFTMNSFGFAGKMLHRVPISSAFEFAWTGERDFESARRRFLWMGSYGMVHKGLDLVLEAFASMPDLELTVCGRPEKEEDFFEAYRRELTALPNVHFEGWVDPASHKFEMLRRTHAAIVYPSCSEGGGGSVIHAMHAGLLPVVTTEASVDIGEFGERIRGESVEDVLSAVRSVATQSPSSIALRARMSWEHARAHHSLPVFERNYGDFVCALAARG